MSTTITDKNVKKNTRKASTSPKKVNKAVKPEPVKELVDQEEMSEAVKQVSATKAILVRLECHFPTNKDRRDKDATEDFHKESHTASQHIMMEFSKEKNKLVNYPEWDAATEWKNEFNKTKNKYTLGLQFRGINIISVHTLEMLRNEIDTLMAKLPNIKKGIADNLQTWKDSDKIRLGKYYNESRYPSLETIDSWGIRSMFAPLDTNLFPENEEFLKEANNARYARLFESFEGMVNAINGYISGEHKSFRNNSIENLIEECEFLSHCEIVEDEKIKKLCETCKEIATKLPIDVIRNNKKIIETARAGTDLSEPNAMLEKTRITLESSLDALKQECEGII
jgi:hypothetical protein